MNVLAQMLWWLPVSNDTCFSEHLKRSPRHSGCRSPHFWSTRTLYAASSANCCSSSQIQLRHAGAIVPNAANWTSMGCHLGMNQHPCDHRMKPVPGCQVPYPLTCKLSKEQNERHRGQQSSNLVFKPCQQFNLHFFCRPVVSWTFPDKLPGNMCTYLENGFPLVWVGLLSPGQHKPSRSTIPPCPMACWEVVGGGDKGGILVRAGQGTSSAARRLVNGIHGGSLLPSNSQAWLGNSF